MVGRVDVKVWVEGICAIGVISFAGRADRRDKVGYGFRRTEEGGGIRRNDE